MSKRVFIGLSDVASFIDDWAFGFEANNVKSLKGGYYAQSPAQNSKLNFVITQKQNLVGYFKPGRISVWFKPWWDKFIKEFYFRRTLQRCDIFVFIYDTFYYDLKDLEILKKYNKKIIVIFVGDDVRWHNAMKQEFVESELPIIEYTNYDFSQKGLESKLFYLRNMERYADLIFSQPNLSQLSLRPYYNLLIPIKSNEYIYDPVQKAIPKIVHAPTSVGKGSKYIIEIIDSLKKLGLKFEFELIQNKPRNEALLMYNNADIIVDQVLTPGGGKLAHEGLAMGKVVLTLMGHGKYDQKKPIDCPLVDVNQNNLYEVLKDLIPNVEKRQNIASKGRPYIEKYHNPKKIVKEILEILQNPESKNPDFYPDFFRNRYIPEASESHLEVYNKWTKYVSDCNWYKQYVKPGNRDGLIF